MKNFKPFLRHIIDECEFIEKVLSNKSFKDFMEDEILKKAIVRSLEVIGEAAKNVTTEIRNRYPQIPWRKISGLRDILIHEYFGVDYSNVWKIASEDIKPLKKEIMEILEREEK